MAKLVFKNLFNDGDIVAVNKQLYDEVRNILYGGFRGIVYASKLKDGKWYYYISAKDFVEKYVDKNTSPRQEAIFEEWFEEGELRKSDPFNDPSFYVACCPG